MIGKQKKYIGRKPHRMIVLSWDAVGSQDLELLMTLPHFRKFFEQSAGCKQVTSIYPSLTYPAHVTIVTGKLPSAHGVVNNLRFQPWRSEPDWFWQRRFIRGTTLYDEAEKAGIKTAALLWPVTGGARISYNLPEIWANRPWEHQVLVSLLNGTPAFQIDLYRRFGGMIDGIRQPMLDDFVQASLIYTLKQYRPGLLFVHLTDVDTNRHEYGVDSKEAEAALIRQDRRLGELMKFLGNLGLWQDTNVILLGDHYQKNVNCVLYPNYHIVQNGWAACKNGHLTNWKVAAQNCDGACYIYLKDRKSKEWKARTAKWLREWKNSPDSGIQAVYTGKQAWDKGADPRCAFMLEAKEGFYFKNGCTKPLERAQEGAGIHLGAHGYDPDEPGYETFFLAAGPDFQPGVRIPQMELIDEGPIMARTLGLELEDADGAVMNALFRHMN